MKIITIRISGDEAEILVKSLEVFRECLPVAMDKVPEKAREALDNAAEFLSMKIKAGLNG